MKMKEKSEKVGLKLNIQKTKIMASGPTTSWEIEGKQWKQCQTIFVKGFSGLGEDLVFNYIDHLTCLLRNPYAGQEATVRIGHGTTYWFQI